MKGTPWLLALLFCALVTPAQMPSPASPTADELIAHALQTYAQQMVNFYRRLLKDGKAGALEAAQQANAAARRALQPSILLGSVRAGGEDGLKIISGNFENTSV